AASPRRPRPTWPGAPGPLPRLALRREPPVLRVPERAIAEDKTPHARRVSTGEDERVQRDHGHIACDLPPRTGEPLCPVARVEDAVGLIEVGGDESLAVAREVLTPPAAESGVEVARIDAEDPGEQRHVELAAL